MFHYLGRGSKACYGDSGDDEDGLPGRWDLTLNIDWYLSAMEVDVGGAGECRRQRDLNPSTDIAPRIKTSE